MIYQSTAWESFSFYCWNWGISWQESQNKAVQCLAGPDPGPVYAEGAMVATGEASHQMPTCRGACGLAVMPAGEMAVGLPGDCSFSEVFIKECVWCLWFVPCRHCKAYLIGASIFWFQASSSEFYYGLLSKVIWQGHGERAKYERKVLFQGSHERPSSH